MTDIFALKQFSGPIESGVDFLDVVPSRFVHFRERLCGIVPGADG